MRHRSVLQLMHAVKRRSIQVRCILERIGNWTYVSALVSEYLSTILGEPGYGMWMFPSATFLGDISQRRANWPDFIHCVYSQFLTQLSSFGSNKSKRTDCI